MGGNRLAFHGGALAASLAAAAVLWTSTSASYAQNPALQDLLDRATIQVVEFVDKFSNVVAEEIYVQEMNRPKKKRTLRSDLALVRYPGATQWMLFRDVYEVDGKPVRGEAEQQRIMRLFLEPPQRRLAARQRHRARGRAATTSWTSGRSTIPCWPSPFCSPTTAATSASTSRDWRKSWGLACAPYASRSSSGPPS